MMRRTVYLPDDLDAQVEEYLKIHRNQTFSSLVRQALKREVAPKDPEALLKLIGLIPKGTPRHHIPLEERQPEDRYTDRDR
jgi:hypothetical protein